jgi:hypothetical protein
MAERYIPEHRRNFKAKTAFKPDELRRRREEQQVEIRKAKREESLAKRRNMAVEQTAAADSDDEGANESQVCLHPHPRRGVLCTPRLQGWLCHKPNQTHDALLVCETPLLALI